MNLIDRASCFRTGRGAGLSLLAALGAILLLTGCGDPVIVLGDQPNIMRVVLGVAPDQDPDEATPATSEAITNPRGLAVDDDGVLYVVDDRAQRILAVFSDGDLETVLDHRSCSQECLTRPGGLALSPDQTSLVVADPLGGAIWRVSIAGGQATPIAGIPGGQEPATGLLATDVDLRQPVGVAAGLDGRIFFSEQQGHRVWALEPDGTLTPVAGTGTVSGGGDGGPATEAGLSLPGGLALVGGDLYIADRGNHRIRVVDLVSGIIRTEAGNGEPAFGGDGGAATQASLRFPDGIAVTSDGATLYIADTGNHRIRSVNLSSGVIRTFAGTGETEFAGSGLEAGDTALDGPGNLAVTDQNLLFIADPGHSLVWRTPVRF